MSNNSDHAISHRMKLNKHIEIVGLIKLAVESGLEVLILNGCGQDLLHEPIQSDITFIRIPCFWVANVQKAYSSLQTYLN